MFQQKRKPVLHAALSLLLLLMGAANLFTVSVDDDGDDDTPPIKLEMNFVASSKKVHVDRENSQQHKHSAPVCHQTTNQGTNDVTHGPSLATNSASPQQVTPLRT
jgi:hypothetical protein